MKKLLIAFILFILFAPIASGYGESIERYKYEVDLVDRYGIYTGTTDNFINNFGNKRYVHLGPAFDNDKIINYYRTAAEEATSLHYQEYLNGNVKKELTAEEQAIQLLESLGYNINK